MKTKQFARWAIVLFLLAALPGLTAVMAQGQGLSLIHISEPTRPY